MLYYLSLCWDVVILLQMVSPLHRTQVMNTCLICIGLHHMKPIQKIHFLKIKIQLFQNGARPSRGDDAHTSCVLLHLSYTHINSCNTGYTSHHYCSTG